MLQFSMSVKVIFGKKEKLFKKLLILVIPKYLLFNVGHTSKVLSKQIFEYVLGRNRGDFVKCNNL